MNAFKFNCPACGQPIEIKGGGVGLTVNCPSCQAALDIPPQPKATGEEETTQPAAKSSDLATPPANASTKPEPTELPSAKAIPPETPPAPAAVPVQAAETVASPARRVASAAASAETQPPDTAPPPTQIATLSADIKLETVRAAHAQLRDESAWMPELKNDGSFAYAGKRVEGQIIEVPLASLEATCFSLFGAVLRELEQRNVIATAPGRKELLDDELPAVIREVSGAGEAGAGTPSSSPNRPTLSHAQCLVVLERLEQRYQREIEAAQAAALKRKIPDICLEDLVGKLESEAPVKAEEVAAALHHELTAIHKRLAQLEAAPGGTPIADRLRMGTKTSLAHRR